MKQAVVGYGKAQKNQVQDMVRRLLQLSGLPGTDAADALGMAIAHAHAGKGLALRALAASVDSAQTAVRKSPSKPTSKPTS